MGGAAPALALWRHWRGRRCACSRKLLRRTTCQLPCLLLPLPTALRGARLAHPPIPLPSWPHSSAAFFRVHSSGQLEYLGTSHHPSPAWLTFPEDSGGEAVERHVSPGYVLYQEQDGDEGSTDSEGYHDSPAVFVVSANCSTNCSSSCCHKLPTTDWMGSRTLQLHPARSCSLCLPACLPAIPAGRRADDSGAS